MIRIAIIDDDVAFCEDLKSKIKDILYSCEIDCYNNVSSFSASPLHYNIAFIDIMLEKNNGIDLAHTLLEQQPSIKIVFMSVEKDFFQDVYSADHVYFLLKPISPEHLEKAVSICCRSVLEQYMYIKHKNEIIAIDLNKVAYFEGMLKKTTVHLTDMTNLIINKPLSTVSTLIKSTNFLRVHQSYIISLNNITSFTKKRIKILDKEIPVSRKYSTETSKILNRFLIDKLA